MYQLQFLFKELILIRNRNGVKSSQTSAVRLSANQDLRKFAKCWNIDFTDSCDPNSSMLGAKSVDDPKIKVVPYVKYYNFALVISSTQGL